MGPSTGGFSFQHAIVFVRYTQMAFVTFVPISVSTNGRRLARRRLSSAQSISARLSLLWREENSSTLNWTRLVSLLHHIIILRIYVAPVKEKQIRGAPNLTQVKARLSSMVLIHLWEKGQR